MQGAPCPRDTIGPVVSLFFFCSLLDVVSSAAHFWDWGIAKFGVVFLFDVESTRSSRMGFGGESQKTIHAGKEPGSVRVGERGELSVHRPPAIMGWKALAGCLPCYDLRIVTLGACPGLSLSGAKAGLAMAGLFF